MKKKNSEDILWSVSFANLETWAKDNQTFPVDTHQEQELHQVSMLNLKESKPF